MQQNSPRRWVPDHEARDCLTCGRAFNTLRRRHHCRVCGNIFCGRCVTKTALGTDVGEAWRCAPCSAPRIISVINPINHLSHVATAGGSMICTLEGVQTPRVLFDGGEIAFEELESAGPMQLQLQIPPGVGRQHSIAVECVVSMLSDSYGIGFSAPKVGACQRLPCTGGAVLIEGSNFGTVLGNNGLKAYLNDEQIPCELLSPHTRLQLMVPPGAGVQTLRLTVLDQSVQLPVFYERKQLPAATSHCAEFVYSTHHCRYFTWLDSTHRGRCAGGVRQRVRHNTGVGRGVPPAAWNPLRNCSSKR